MTRIILAVLVAGLVISMVSPSKWLCGRQDAYGQFPGQHPLTPRDMTQFDMIQAGYVEQVKKLYVLLYEGMLTRPGHEKDEEEKFTRGLRMARKARERAQTLIFIEPWEVVRPLGQTGREEEEKKTTP